MRVLRNPDLDTCLCGQPLPRHLADAIAKSNNRSMKYTHHCSCDRVWRLQGICFVHDLGETDVRRGA